MWPQSEALASWCAAMDRQTDHEAMCLPCQANRTPVCPEGVRLKEAARLRHEFWVIDEYAGKAVA